MQKGGMVVSYMNEKCFRDFIRSAIALAFLPLNQIEAAIDDLITVDFEKDSLCYEKMCAFKTEYLDYIESTWIYGGLEIEKITINPIQSDMTCHVLRLIGRLF